MPLIKDKLFYKIKRLTGRAIGDFNLIEDGDHIAVAVSGGKDSYTLFHMLEILRRRAPVSFRLTLINIDPGYPGYRKELIEEYARAHGFSCRMVCTNCAAIIEQKRTPGSSHCSFCARLRRGVLYTQAEKEGCNKIALGHHLDDFIETLLLNQFYTGTLAAMSPKLLADNKQHTVIRPLVYVEEADIACFSSRNHFPVIGCSCPMCGEEDLQRTRIKALLGQLSRENPGIKQSLISALGRVEPRHLMDKRLKTF